MLKKIKTSKMGLAASNANVRNTVNSLTSIVNESVSDATEDSSTNCSGINVFRGLFGVYPTEFFPNGQVRATAPCPQGDFSNVTINQIAQQTCNIDGGITQSLNSEITANLTRNIRNWLDVDANANNGFLAAGVSIASSGGLNEDDLAARIASVISSNLSSTCQSFLTGSNNGVVSFCGSYPDGIEINQKAININLTSCIINNTVTNIQRDTVLNNIVEQAAARADARNEGLGSLLAPFRWLIIGVVVIAALIIIGIILYLLFGGSKTAVKPQQLAGLVRPEVRVCEAEVKAKLAEEGRAGDRNAELFLIDRCLKERKAEERFRNNPESFAQREPGRPLEGAGIPENIDSERFSPEAAESFGSSARRFSERMKGYARSFSEGYGRTPVE